MKILDWLLARLFETKKKCYFCGAPADYLEPLGQGGWCRECDLSEAHLIRGQAPAHPSTETPRDPSAGSRSD